MKINWKPSKRLCDDAVKISELKPDHTYPELAQIFKRHRTYIIALKQLGDKLRGVQS